MDIGINMCAGGNGRILTCFAWTIYFQPHLELSKVLSTLISVIKHCQRKSSPERAATLFLLVFMQPEREWVDIKIVLRI